MTKTEIENRICDLKRTIESYENIIKASENEIKKLEAEKEPALERVEKGLHYYSVKVDGCGVATAELYVDNHTIFNDAMFKNNNYFLTEERAKEVTDKINFLLKLERLHDIYCPDYKPDWNNVEENKWYATFDSNNKKYTRFWTNVHLEAVVYFDSKETADKVCEILNKEIENAQLPRFFVNRIF